jgi:protein TonB
MIFVSRFTILFTKPYPMKNIIILCILASVLVIGQGCASKTDEAKAEQAKAEQAAADESMAPTKLVKLRTAEEVSATRAKIAKARAEKEAQRQLAIAEKVKVTPTYKDASGKIVYYKAEVDPSYNGGLNEMRKYLRDNLVYPEAAREAGFEGTVFVDFTVDEQGKIRDVVASDVIGDDVDQAFKTESVRVVSAMPGWRAGRQHGKAVDASFSIPITFELD